MALDSKQKRGSATSLTLPYRSWLAEPDGTLADTDRVSLLKYCSAIEPGEPAATVDGPYYVAAQEVYSAGAVATEVFVAGDAAREVSS